MPKRGEKKETRRVSTARLLAGSRRASRQFGRRIVFARGVRLVEELLSLFALLVELELLLDDVSRCGAAAGR